MMKEKKFIFSMLTWCSLLLFVLLIVTISLTPLSETSESANDFNSIGMYAAIGFIAICYLIPYGFYVVGIKSVKYVMAVLCAFGCLIAVTTCLTIAGAMYLMDDAFYHFLIPLIVSFFMLCVNLIWFIAAFTRSQNNRQAI